MSQFVLIYLGQPHPKEQTSTKLLYCFRLVFQADEFYSAVLLFSIKTEATLPTQPHAFCLPFLRSSFCLFSQLCYKPNPCPAAVTQQSANTIKTPHSHSFVTTSSSEPVTCLLATSYHLLWTLCLGFCVSWTLVLCLLSGLMLCFFLHPFFIVFPADSLFLHGWIFWFLCITVCFCLICIKTSFFYVSHLCSVFHLDPLFCEILTLWHETSSPRKWVNIVQKNIGQLSLQWHHLAGRPVKHTFLVNYEVSILLMGMYQSITNSSIAQM